MANDKGHRMRYRRAFAENDDMQTTIDALAAALTEARECVDGDVAALGIFDRIDAALALARGGK